MCYPGLDPLGRNVPISILAPIELSIVFVIAAPRYIHMDVSLESVIISIPVGNQNTDIL